MKKEILSFIEQNQLSPFEKSKVSSKEEGEEIFKTKDARAIHMKVLAKLSSNFKFDQTSLLWQAFPLTNTKEEIEKRQGFFREITERKDNASLKKLKVPKAVWKPKYSVITVTEDEDTLMQLKKADCPVQFLISQYDVESLAGYELIQVINCEQFSHMLERLPQTVFIDQVEDIYLERFLILLSSWKENIEILEREKTNPDIEGLLYEIQSLFPLLEEKRTEVFSKEEADRELERMNEVIFSKLKNLTISGEVLFSMMNKKELPLEIREILRTEINQSRLHEGVLRMGLPLSLDEKELDAQIQAQNANEFATSAERVKKNAKELKALPQKLQRLSEQLLLFDFMAGISNYITQTTAMPETAEELSFEQAQSLLIENAQPISFHLTNAHRCSMLTGANSGGKTTLLEHILQVISLYQLGLPMKGKVRTPLFTEVFYFAKNKGSQSKGAFETLLTQMSMVKPGKRTLILADEIEAVTEPGVAGKIISATADYFSNKGCFLVFATHLGQEIQNHLPSYARIDGIEAKGLDENNELIVDHSPVIGRLASSTPELIIEKMYKTKQTEYFNHLYSWLKNSPKAGH